MMADETTFQHGRRMAGTSFFSPTVLGRSKSGRCLPTAAIRSRSRLQVTTQSRTGVGNRFFVVLGWEFLISLEGRRFDPTGMNRTSQGVRCIGESKYETRNVAMGRPGLRIEGDAVPWRVPRKNCAASSTAASYACIRTH